jgi:hypothetical protein
MQDDKLVMVMIMDGQPAGPPMAVTKRNDSYVCEMSNEYFSMTISVKPDGDNLKGLIYSDQWEMAIVFTPEKK